MGDSFQKTQFTFAAHLRDPEASPAPEGMEDRRLGIYRDLIYNNIEGFISSGFPVLREITADERWHEMVRDFVRRHRCETPYFLKISEEFLAYLQNERDRREDPPFLLELAHYEWVELALDVADESFPAERRALPSHPTVSPLAWNLSYRWPVHRIGPDYQPLIPPDDPTFLVVYRNRQEQVRFLESNAATSRLLVLLSQSQGLSGEQALRQLALEMQTPDPESILVFGRDLIAKLVALDILV
ncbi:DUF2063 domain-containing protein [Proteobacteria bacterium 005FR1]|nr:DUF2063 domain-containing protein [Proteobacteria bacterium 005FR1]